MDGAMTILIPKETCVHIVPVPAIRRAVDPISCADGPLSATGI